MNKRKYIFLIALLSFIGVSYTSKVTVSGSYLRNFNNKLKTGMVEDGFPLLRRWNDGMAEPHLISHISYPTSHFFGIKTVVIDAGHGGKDPGCVGKNIYEKDAALGIALKLGKYIEEKTPDVKVIYTRKTDVFIELDERAAIANRNKADLFICIHCNIACVADKKTKKVQCNESISGSETYVMGLHKTNANLNVAMRENQSILFEKNYKKRYDNFDPNSETGYILLTMQQNAYLKQSLNFAAKIQKQLKEKAGRLDKGVQQAGFLVLWKTAMPSVLIETDFISNPEAEKLLGQEKGQDVMARALFSAFRQYKDEVEGKYVKYDDEIEQTVPFIPEKDTIGAGDKGQESPQDSSIMKNEILPPVKTDSVNKTETRNDPVTTINYQLPTTNIIYKVQFLSSAQRVPFLSEKFKGLKDVGEYEDAGLFKYTAGEFTALDEALKYRTEMQAKGYKDCFVVKFKDGKRMKK